jgi:hypothetical protein
MGAQFVPNVALSQKLFWTHLIVLLGEEAQVDARFSSPRDSAKHDARYVHGLCLKYHSLINRFGCT